MKMQLVLPSAILMIEFFEKSVKKHNFWCSVFVCVLLRPVNNGRSQLRAGGRWCLTSSVYGDVSSQCPPLPPIVNTHHRHRHSTPTWNDPGARKRETQVRRFSGGKVGRDGAKWLFLHEIGAKLERRIGKIVLRSEWCGSFLRRQSCPHILCCTFLPSYNCSVLLCLPISWAFSCW